MKNRKLPGLIIIWICGLCFISLCSCTDNRPPAEWPAVTREAKPWTRWWWMGSAVDEANLSNQLHTMSESGIGGVEITPIYGVKGEEAKSIPYLTPHWMRMLYFSESEAKRVGMGVDMSMGTGWPFGGPQVSVEDAATRVIVREYTLKGGQSLPEKISAGENKQDSTPWLEKVMAYTKGKEALDLTGHVNADRILDWTAPKGSDFRVIALFTGKTGQMVKRAAPGGEGLVLNPFDAGAVQRYFAHFDKAFAGIRGSYPHSFFHDSFEVYGADWTPDFLDRFEERRGYRLEYYLPELLADGDTDRSRRVISDYRETLGDLLKENFFVAWTEWAHSRGTTTRNQAHGSPANLIDLYAAVDIPEGETFGITDFDIPGLRKDSIRKENDGDPATLKYASSAAHIAGKKYTSAETFTWLTEHFRTSLSQCKPEIDQMFVSGINHVYFHGTTYSPKEAAWPGWKFYASVDMSPTNPMWRDAPAFFRYITRVQSFLQEGEPDSDFLLYLPIYDFWHEQRGNYYLSFPIHGMRDRLPEFYRTVSSIRDSGYDTDYISDQFLRTATVDNGMIRTEGGASYKALILPSVKRLPPETLEKVRQLAEEGATVVFAGQYPGEVPGLYQAEERKSRLKTITGVFPQVKDFRKTNANQMDKGTVITGTNYAEMLSLCHAKMESFRTQQGGQYIRRKHADGYTYFFTMLQNKPVDGWVSLGTEAKEVIFFDPMAGMIGEARTRIKDNQTAVYLQLKPGQSIIVKTYEKNAPAAPAWVYYRETGEKIAFTGNWKMKFIRSVPEVKETFTLKEPGSWTDLPEEILRKNMGTARYSTTVRIEKKADREYLLRLGDVRESAQVIVNGEPVSTLFAAPFEIRIGTYLKDGENTIDIEVTNLPANRIADYDRRGVEWRKFHDINFVDIGYKNIRYDSWEVIPSGLLGPVSIDELAVLRPEYND